MNKQKRNIIIENLVSLVMCGTVGAIVMSADLPLIRVASEYSVHIMLGMLAATMVFMLMEKQRIMFAGLICTSIMALWLKNASHTDLKLPLVNQEVNLKVAQVNLSNIDDRLGELVDIFLEDNIDVISFQELTPDWTQVLDNEFSKFYSHKYTNVRIDPYGIAIYSRLPFKQVDTIQTNGIPSLCIEVLNNNEVFHIISSYLTPALDNKSLATASDQLQRIAKKVNENSDHVIALGEYNMVYWTQELRDFCSATKLRNSRRDISQGNLRVPYDHIFFSEDMECTQFQEIIGDGNKYLGIVGIYQLKTTLPRFEDWSLAPQ